MQIAFCENTMGVVIRVLVALSMLVYSLSLKGPRGVTYGRIQNLYKPHQV